MDIRVYKQPADVNKALADVFVEICSAAISKKGRAAVALSGGSTPKKFHELLASEYSQSLPWGNIDFFFGDERYVPFDHPDNNGLMAKNTLFDPLGIGASQIYYMDTSLEPPACAQDYQERLTAYFGNGQSTFDLVLLGLGDNVHTASLFPHTTVLEERSALVKEVYVDEIKAMRITLTAPAITSAAHIAFLVYGTAKAEAIQLAIEGSADYRQYPAQLVLDAQTNVSWFLDEAAAARLSQK